MRTYLNNDWLYFKHWTDDIFTIDGGEQVRLPHTNIETPFNCFDESIYQFVSGYRGNFHLDSVSGKYVITFEGIAHNAELFINGASVATHRCGYTALTVDITDFVSLGNNQIVVKVDSRESLNQPPFGNVIDYLTYGGIYREVYLDHYEGVYVKNAFVIAEPHKCVKVQVELSQYNVDTTVTAEILDGTQSICSVDFNTKNHKFTMEALVDLQNWTLDHPKLYTMKLTVDGNVWQSTFGVRSAVFQKDGFYLNGEHVKLVGLNRHQSYPYVGYAMPESMQRRDARILKYQLGVNVVRTSHYPQSHYFLDECDKIGLLVFTEIPGWQHIGDGNWKAAAMINVADMVLQYRNHPSIILWGVRINESVDCEWLYKKTNALAHGLDETRQTGGVRYLTHSQLLEDVYTFNDFNRLGATNRNKVCDKDVPYLVTEYNGHMFPTKSYDDYPHRREHMLRYARMLDGVFGSPNTCGAIGWCMFDYNTHKDFGSGDRICYHGVTDMFRNPKMAAGVFCAQRKKDNPFLSVCFTTDIGDYPEGAVGEMYCLTNADAIDVYKGDTLIKRYKHANSPFKHLPNPPILIDDLIGERLTTEDGIDKKHAVTIKKVIADIKKYGLNDIPLSTKLKIAKIMAATKLPLEKLADLYRKYEGNWGSTASALTIKAIRAGKVVAQQTVGSPNRVEIKLEVSSLELHENTTYDVAAINISAVDQHGNVLPYINKTVHFKTDGVVQLIGPTEIALMGGMAGTYVKTVGKIGVGHLYVDDQVVEFTVK